MVSHSFVSHHGGTNLTETYAMTPSVTVKDELIRGER